MDTWTTNTLRLRHTEIYANFPVMKYGPPVSLRFTRVNSGQVNTVKFGVKSGVRTSKLFLLSQLLPPLWSDDQSRPQKILNVCTYACIRFTLTKKSPILFFTVQAKKNKTFPEKIFLISLTPTGTVPPQTKGLSPKRKSEAREGRHSWNTPKNRVQWARVCQTPTTKRPLVFFKRIRLLIERIGWVRPFLVRHVLG